MKDQTGYIAASARHYGIENLAEKLSQNFSGIYLLDPAPGTITPIKVSYDLRVGDDGTAVLNETQFYDILKKIVAPEFRSTLLDFIDRRTVPLRLTTMDDREELRYRQVNGEWRKAILQPLGIEDGRAVKVLMTLTDITETITQYERLTHENSRNAARAAEYTQLFMHAAEDLYAGVWRLDLSGGRVIRLGIRNGEVIETPLEQSWIELYQKMLPAVHPDDRTDFMMKTHPNALLALPDQARIKYTFRCRFPREDYRWYSSSVRKTVSEDGRHLATLFTMDVTSDLFERARLKDSSEHDQLTDLFNRTKLEQMLCSEYPALKSCGVLFFDLNDLKVTNDTRGHAAGDRMLRLAAESIRSITNRRVHAYRYGGDEFLVVACNCTPTQLDQLVVMWQRRLETLTMQAELGCSMAVGRAWGRAPTSVHELIRRADMDMYRCKSEMKAES